MTSGECSIMFATNAVCAFVATYALNVADLELLKEILKKSTRLFNSSVEEVG